MNLEPPPRHCGRRPQQKVAAVCGGERRHADHCRDPPSAALEGDMLMLTVRGPYQYDSAGALEEGRLAQTLRGPYCI